MPSTLPNILNSHLGSCLQQILDDVRVAPSGSDCKCCPLLLQNQQHKGVIQSSTSK